MSDKYQSLHNIFSAKLTYFVKERDNRFKMRRIGLLSDTHGDVPQGLFSFFEKCDEIWHAGDIGSDEKLLELTGHKVLRAVYGNIDSQEIRLKYPGKLRFTCEKAEVFMTHIGGYPGHYDPSMKQEITFHTPNVFVCGHSHILRVMYDNKLDLLLLNPGAAGRNGFHPVCTALRFVIDGTDFRDMEIWEMEKG
jgi:uncharacterized protein